MYVCVICDGVENEAHKQHESSDEGKKKNEDSNHAINERKRCREKKGKVETIDWVTL